MDALSKKLFKELEEMQCQAGRMLRNMSLVRMLPFESGQCCPHVDVYESEGEIYVYFDLAGADAETLSVVADERQVRVTGKRDLPAHENVACIHQLEIELGSFDRVVSLPAAVDVDHVTSSYKNGILMIVFPKKRKAGKVSISIAVDES